MWIVVEVVLRDLGRVEAGVGLDLDHVTGVAGRGQILAAEITREVDHQRFIPQLMSRSQVSGERSQSDSNRGAWVRPSPVLVIPGIQKRADPVKARMAASIPRIVNASPYVKSLG